MYIIVIQIIWKECKINKIFNYLKRPLVFQKSSAKFWDDEHISQEMLKAHLNPNIDAASRKPEIIEKTVEWICNLAPYPKFTKILDLGCGPGLYADMLNKKGYQVTGIDFSKRSIDYAKSINHNNQYIYQNYLDIEYENEFDIVLLIYCDYGVLADDERKLLLKKIYKALKAGGMLLLDVFTPNNYLNDQERTSWYINNSSGFWKPTPHLCLEAHYIYDNDIRLDMYLVVDEFNNIDIYRIWDKSFTKETFSQEVMDIAFSEVNFYANTTGDIYKDDSKTMSIVLIKGSI